jgi:menaquinone-dependent protoporphyrinogen oxidase
MTLLVAYASKHGSTQGIAEAIGKRLRERGLDTDVRPVREVDGLERYDTIVLGSAVYLGAWLKEAMAFVDRLEATLRRVPLWLCSSGSASSRS